MPIADTLWICAIYIKWGKIPFNTTTNYYRLIYFRWSLKVEHNSSALNPELRKFCKLALVGRSWRLPAGLTTVWSFIHLILHGSVWSDLFIMLTNCTAVELKTERNNSLRLSFPGWALPKLNLGPLEYYSRLGDKQTYSDSDDLGKLGKMYYYY